MNISLRKITNINIEKEELDSWVSSVVPNVDDLVELDNGKVFLIKKRKFTHRVMTDTTFSNVDVILYAVEDKNAPLKLST